MGKRIYLAYTGGTIGMQPSSEGLAPSGGFEGLLAQRLPAGLPEFDCHSYAELIDSSNIVPGHWLKIAQDILRRSDQYDGFVILHGTDTMAYSASALAFLLRGLNKPVILTGSQLPLAQARTDAVDNIIHSLELAGSDQLKEVGLCFGSLLLRGCRARKVHSQGYRAFASPNFPPLAEVGIQLKLAHHLLRPAAPMQVLPFPSAYEEPQVLPLQIFPGIDGAFVRQYLARPERGILLQSYGAGNGPDLNADFLAALRELHDAGKRVINLTQCQAGGVSAGSYAAGSALTRAGVIAGGDLTPEAAFCKLHHLLALSDDLDWVAAEIHSDWAGELS